ncbi:hypothetical protein AH6C_045 [Aeromonas phage pAh6-C]|uniref:Uncharacterized protein n=1 Tax=Aeromonas phage pAh6-C TaxID=1505227 RepID=A0A076GAG9_9CAUD|nr:hypothetical protein AH6C_045 [Aeromonas phage pAh6-C]AII26799.1 hypothetical protein AH6C_045 [Aeromonas phage pAh6-C]
MELRVIDIYCFDTTTKNLPAEDRVVCGIKGYVTDKNDHDTIVDLLAGGEFVDALSLHNKHIPEGSQTLKFSDMEIRVVERAAV